jgi:hypothetical protein
MGIILAIIFIGIAVMAAITYSATPHGGPTTSCGPITVFQHTFTIHADCRYVSVGELVATGLFFFLALAAALSARPRS